MTCESEERDGREQGNMVGIRTQINAGTPLCVYTPDVWVNTARRADERVMARGPGVGVCSAVSARSL